MIVNQKKVISICMIFVMLFSCSTEIMADTGYDETAPVLKSFRILNPDQLDTRNGGNSIEMEFELEEEGTGVTNIDVCFQNEEGKEFEIVFWCQNWHQDPIYTGKAKVKMFVIGDKTKIKPGKYKITNVTLSDGNENYFYASSGRNPEIWEKSTKEVNVIKTDYQEKTDTESPIVRGMKICNTENVNSKKTLNIEFDFKEMGSGLHYIHIYCKNGFLGSYTFDSWQETKIDGKKTLPFKISGAQKGENEITKVVVADWEDNETIYDQNSSEWNNFLTKFYVTETAESPVLNSFQIKNTKVATPGLLYADIDFDGDQDGIEAVYLRLENKDGKQNILECKNEKPLKKGKQKIAFSISPFWGVGKWKIAGVGLEGASGKTSWYDKNSENEDALTASKFLNQEITISSSYDITYYGSVGNYKTAVKKINEMKDGQTAVLDCRYSKIAKKELFQAIAGKNKILVFEDEDVQWIFCGKNVKLSKCKDIDLETKVMRRAGKNYGYADDTYILYMEYADNGELPGKVEMRVNYDYLFAKYQAGNQKLILTYYDRGELKVLNENVQVAKDEYAEYKITHNSTYLLSQNNPRLLAPTGVKAISYQDKQIKLTWKRVAGAGGYEIYRSTSSKGTSKKIASVKGNSKVSYVDKKTSIGKKYYYRIKAAGNQKKVKAAYSTKVSCKAVPEQVKKVNTTKRGKKIRISWNSVHYCSGYEIYMSTKKDNGYKRKGTTKDVAYMMGNLKKRKIYYFKVRSYKKVKGRKYYGSYSQIIRRHI